jgi:hypothetical protein
MAEFEKFENLSFLKTDRFWTPNFWYRVAHFSEPRSQPTVKVYRQHNAMHVYRLIPRNMHLYVVWVRAQTITIIAELTKTKVLPVLTGTLLCPTYPVGG